jgi:four helix bundle protein
MNYEKGKDGAIDIYERTERYALRAVKLYQYLQKRRDGVGMVIGKQYFRAATSIGANLVEARSGESRRDFIHKCAIAQKEARESKYWLTLLHKSATVPPARLHAILDETNQIIAILARIILNTKKGVARQGIAS